MLYEIQVYEKSNKKLPFNDWLHEQDAITRNIIRVKLDRISLGNFSTCKSLGNGISEIKINIGPGYRIYYNVTGKTILLLLCAGTKRTQQKDIAKAQEYLLDYKNRGAINAKK